mmetsp:Transcript_45964/g.80338  ORF Transcript_45964/g.80338 Transcript_45964/m.80338 type:complete len:279 (+) Transcript_45964:222-1058(+)
MAGGELSRQVRDGGTTRRQLSVLVFHLLLCVLRQSRQCCFFFKQVGNHRLRVSYFHGKALGVFAFTAQPCIQQRHSRSVLFLELVDGGLGTHVSCEARGLKVTHTALCLRSPPLQQGGFFLVPALQRSRLLGETRSDVLQIFGLLRKKSTFLCGVLLQVPHSGLQRRRSRFVRTLQLTDLRPEVVNHDTKLLRGSPQLLHLLLRIGALGGFELLLLGDRVQALSEVPQRTLHPFALLLVQALHSPIQFFGRPSITSGFLSFKDQFGILLCEDVDFLFK